MVAVGRLLRPWAGLATCCCCNTVSYTLTINTVGSGSVTPNPAGGVYEAGSLVSLSATPDAGWVFSGWSGDLGGAANPETLLMDADKVVTATFVADTELVLESYSAATGTGTGATVSKPTGTETGDLLVGHWLFAANRSVSANPTGMTRQAGHAHSVSSAHLEGHTYSRIADGSEGASLGPTLSGSADYIGTLLRFSNADTTTPLDTVAYLDSNTEAAASGWAPGVRVLRDGSMLVAILAIREPTAQTIVAPAGWSIVAQTNKAGTYIGTLAVYTRSADRGWYGAEEWSWDASDPYYFHMLVVRPASGTADSNVVSFAGDGAVAGSGGASTIAPQWRQPVAAGQVGLPFYVFGADETASSGPPTAGLQGYDNSGTTINDPRARLYEKVTDGADGDDTALGAAGNAETLTLSGVSLTASSFPYFTGVQSEQPVDQVAKTAPATAATLAIPSLVARYDNTLLVAFAYYKRDSGGTDVRYSALPTGWTAISDWREGSTETYHVTLLVKERDAGTEASANVTFPLNVEGGVIAVALTPEQVSWPPATGSAYTADTFNRADTSAGTLGSTDTGATFAWASLSQYKIASNRAVNLFTLGDFEPKVGSMSVGQAIDVRSVVRINSATGYGGLLLRSSASDDSGLVVMVDNNINKLNVFYLSGGAFDANPLFTAADVTCATSTDYDMRVVVVANRIWVAWDGAWVFEGEYLGTAGFDRVANTYAGLAKRASSTEHDNFEVYEGWGPT